MKNLFYNLPVWFFFTMELSVYICFILFLFLVILLGVRIGNCVEQIEEWSACWVQIDGMHWSQISPTNRDRWVVAINESSRDSTLYSMPFSCVRIINQNYIRMNIIIQMFMRQASVKLRCYFLFFFVLWVMFCFCGDRILKTDTLTNHELHRHHYEITRLATI